MAPPIAPPGPVCGTIPSAARVIARHDGGVLELSEWAKDILRRSHEAARRFNPEARIRLARVGGVVQATLTDAPAADDQQVDVDGVTVFVQAGLEGLVDIEEPHDRVVLRPLGSVPNDRGAHG
jgi:hypothetical protein